jgi:hypothetical protein
MITFPTPSLTAACTPWTHAMISLCSGSRIASSLPRRAPTMSPSGSRRIQPHPPEPVFESKTASHNLPWHALQADVPTPVLRQALLIPHCCPDCTRTTYRLECRVLGYRPGSLPCSPSLIPFLSAQQNQRMKQHFSCCSSFLANTASITSLCWTFPC